MGILQIATVGDDTRPIMMGVREFPVAKLVLVHDTPHASAARKLQAQLAPLEIAVETVEIRAGPREMLLEVLKVISDLVGRERIAYDDVYVNVASGPPMLTCAAVSGAFVNGVKAFGEVDGRPLLLPVLKFSYTELVSEPKLNILRALKDAGGRVDSLNELSEKSGVEKSLLSYHVRGGRDGKGLEELGLVGVDRSTQGRLRIQLTPMGETILLGCCELRPLKREKEVRERLLERSTEL